MIRTRQFIVAREEAGLAPYAQMSGASAGRKHPEPPHPLRTEYQRDCARIIHSRAFRRLEYKTQVFLNGTGDHLRTRLTHTMEVVSISRSMARALALNEDLAEAIALGHDLGHPPFGHAGERALNERMAGHGGFDHNAQSLRILEWLEKKYPQFDGLNLTYELLEGLQKHRKLFDPPSRKNTGENTGEGGEPGEKNRVGGADTALPYTSPSLEAQIANIADEIAYYSHDLDDGLDFNLIEPDQLSQLEIWRETWEEVKGRYPALCGRDLYSYVIRCMIDREVEDVIRTSAGLLEESGVASVKEVRRRKQPLIRYGGTVLAANGQLRKFLYENLYHHPEVAAVNQRACEMLRAVFDAYLENPAMLGDDETRREQVRRDGLHRVVCDYLSGMTDRYLIECHKHLFPKQAGAGEGLKGLVKRRGAGSGRGKKGWG